ncbi:membrane fusion protein of tripartite multidrug resistance system [Methyloprofundus sedimenti]|uniref:Membrane fusion protein of tripartite multidrug resistance system n=1 Tax=Methyloprofundus sedimenti TaxID=1420851 RepID=A0A1V8M9G1_9GAMM|nr:HlyD family efflux transporter periplasmic adaptor subunit [Methyloprofundus sedimenti]OQK18158.1 membrane fusion protein of tripartite multidrug resistance system [Methyloprofundus sedimenti]
MQKLIRPKAIIRQRRRRLIMVTAIILLASMAYFVRWWYLNRDWETTDDAFITGHLISLKAQTDGTVVEILAENTQYVQAGQVLVKLDGARAQIDLQQAQAELAETLRDIVTLKTRIDTLQQRMEARKAEFTKVQHDLRRFDLAVREGAVSEQQVQNARDQVRALEASIAAIKAEKSGIEAQILGQSVAHHPAVEKAKSKLRRAFLAYHRRNVVAPISGFVAKRKAQVGNLVEAGAQLMVIVPMYDVWVEANFLETKLAAIRPGQSAEIRVDAYGKAMLYHGRVIGINPGTGSSFALLPTNNANGNFIHITERVPIRIAIDAEELRQNPLLPGLSTLTRVNTSEPGEPMLNSEVNTAGTAYRTDVFSDELDGVEQMIAKIIVANTVAVR